MKVSTEQLSKNIALEVAKLLLPRIKKIIKEEVQATVKDLVYESVISRSKKVRSLYENDELEDDEPSERVPAKKTSSNNVSEAKEAVARRQHEMAARQKGAAVAKKLFGNDMLADLVMDAVDPAERINNKILERENRILSTPVVDVSEIKAEDVATGKIDPENIDFSRYLE